MSKGQFNNRQKDISRLLRDRQARIKGAPKTGLVPRQNFKIAPKPGQ